MTVPADIVDGDHPARVGPQAGPTMPPDGVDGDHPAQSRPSGGHDGAADGSERMADPDTGTVPATVGGR
jgi:hypothetical protein